MAIFTVTAGGGTILVLVQATSDANAAAASVSSYAARKAAADLTSSTALLQATVASLAAVPNTAQVAVQPNQCHLSFATVEVFTAGHYDIVKPDGSIACSSRARTVAAVTPSYAGIGWLAAALSSPILEAPSVDPSNGLPSILSASPIPAGGAVVAFVDLAPVGAEIARRYAGVGHLEFVVTTANGGAVLARSLPPARWIGASLAGTAFSGSASSGQRADLDGTQRLYGMATAAGTGWQVYAGGTVSEALDAANQRFRQELAILLIGLGLVAIGCSFVYRAITRPIARLSSAVRNAPARDVLQPLPVEGPTEVRTLAVDLNVLIASMARERAERRRVEGEVQVLNAGLEERVSQRTEQLEAVNQELVTFSYRVAHDLRAPLRAIDGFAEILETDHSAELSAAGLSHLARVRAAANRMSDVIHDLLEYSRLARIEIHRGRVEMRPLVDRVVASLVARSPEREVKVVVGPLPACDGDAELLEQVLLNLISNSWKFTAGQESATVEIGSEISDGVPCYFVRDNGVGFKSDQAVKVFEVFQREHRAEDFPGTGVGLAIVKRIVLRHGGRVWAESRPGHGATFRFTISKAAGESPFEDSARPG
jgi:signal transduction histidine kinase